jgi:hypothetical protein
MAQVVGTAPALRDRRFPNLLPVYQPIQDVSRRNGVSRFQSDRACQDFFVSELLVRFVSALGSLSFSEPSGRSAAELIDMCKSVVAEKSRRYVLRFWSELDVATR